MIKQLLFTACAALLTVSVSAQETSVTNPTADTWVGTGQTKSNGSSNTVEIHSYTSDSKTTNYYALLAFSFTKPNAGYTVKKATLRLTTRYKKGDSEVKLYDFPGGFKETDVYSTLESSITSALAATAAADFKLNSYNNWAPTDKQVTSDYSSVDKWQVNVDVTDLVKSHANDGQVSMLLQKVYNQDNSSQIYSKEATDVTNSTLNFTFKAADLYPQLTVEYEEETGVTTKIETSAKDTWIWNTSTSDYSEKQTMEIQKTSTTTTPRYSYGLLAFSLPGSNYIITSAQLRLTTERIKGNASIDIFAYGNDFDETTNYSKEESYVTAATSSTALESFTVNGVWNKALGTDAIASDVADITKWQTTIDLTDYANSLGSENMNILLSKTNDENSQTRIFTKEQGDLSIPLSDGSTTTASASDLIPQLTLVYKKASYDLTVGDAGAATLVLPYEATIPSGVKAYTLSYTSGDEVTATEVSATIPANTPVLVNATAGNYTFEATDTKTTKAAAPAKDALTGVWTSTTVPTGSYILYNGTDGLGFYKVTGNNTIAANGAYLTATAATAKSLKINYNSTTNINKITTDEDANAPVYNIQGMRMGKNLPKGIYIKNGKKFVVK